MRHGQLANNTNRLRTYLVEGTIAHAGEIIEMEYRVNDSLRELREYGIVGEFSWKLCA
jgi:hypothetical protein